LKVEKFIFMYNINDKKNITVYNGIGRKTKTTVTTN